MSRANAATVYSFFPAHPLKMRDGRGVAEHHAGLHSGPAVRPALQGDGRQVWLEPCLRLLRQLHLLLLISHAQSFRRRHHGQLRLPDARLVDSRRPSSRRVRQDMGRVRSQRHG